MKNNN